MQTEKEYISERSIIGLHSESVGEYPLPDYNGDVKRVLMISPRVTTTGKYMNESSLEFSGNVFYDVVYLDAQNNVSRAEFSTEFDLGMKQDPESYEDSAISTSIASYNVRLIGPRKFSAKASLSSDIRVLEKRSLQILGDAADEDAETLCEDADVLTSVLLFADATQMREDVAFIEGAIEDEVRLLACDVSTGEVSAVCDEGACEIKCDIFLKLIYQNANEPISIKQIAIPYSAKVESTDIDGCLSLFGKVNVSELATELAPGDDGVGIAVSLSVSPSLRGVKNERVEVIRDAYLRDKGTSNEYRDFGYTEHICSGSAMNAFTAKIPLADVTDAPVFEIISADAVLSREGAFVTHDGVMVKGELRFSALAKEKCNDGEDYINLKFSVPFEQNVNMNCQMHDNMRAEASVCLSGEKVEIIDGHLLVGCNLYTQACVNSERKMRCLGASYLTDEEYVKEASVITVYYPDAKESVFDIAKRFHTSVRKISEDNALAESVFNAKDAPVSSFGYKKLMIK